MSTPKPLPPILNKFILNTANLAGAFLDSKDLASISTACSGTRALFKKPRQDKKAAELLRQVLKANPTKVKAMLASIKQEKTSHKSIESKESKETSECLVLKRTQGKEEYQSKNTGEMICIRAWKNISPLEAAAWCGDNFLVKELLQHIPKELYPTAASHFKASSIEKTPKKTEPI